MASQATPAPNANWLKQVASPPDATLDIVAVHGMNIEDRVDHADNTWTDKGTGTNWLRDLLPIKVPYGRIMAYCYNANILFEASSAGIEEQAKNLLLCLSSERKSTPARPIIFVAHSMGGILVKAALAAAHQRGETYAVIATMTYGIFFFGVPHYGSKHASWGQTAAHIVRKINGRVNESFLKAVEARSAYNDELNARFEPLLQMYRFFTICETKDEVLGGINIGMIVDRDSAILKGCPQQQIEYWPNRSHRTLCKFASTDPEWNVISKMLTAASDHAVKSVFYSPLPALRRDLFQDRLWSSQETEKATPLPKAIEQAQKCCDLIETEIGPGGKLYHVQAEIEQLDGDILSYIGWFLSIVGKVMLVPAIIPLLIWSSVLPSRETALENAEKTRSKEKRIMEIEGDITARLDMQRCSAMMSIIKLEDALSAHQETNIGPKGYGLALGSQVCFKLHEDVERLIYETRRHSESYQEAKRRVNLIENAEKEMEGKTDTELWVAMGEKSEEERRLQEQRLQEQKRTGSVPQRESRVCPICVIQ